MHGRVGRRYGKDGRVQDADDLRLLQYIEQMKRGWQPHFLPSADDLLALLGVFSHFLVLIALVAGTDSFLNLLENFLQFLFGADVQFAFY